MYPAEICIYLTGSNNPRVDVGAFSLSIKDDPMSAFIGKIKCNEAVAPIREGFIRVFEILENEDIDAKILIITTDRSLHTRIEQTLDRQSRRDRGISVPAKNQEDRWVQASNRYFSFKPGIRESSSDAESRRLRALKKVARQCWKGVPFTPGTDIRSLPEDEGRFAERVRDFLRRRDQ